MCLQHCSRNHSVKKWNSVAQWLQHLRKSEIGFWLLLWLPVHWNVPENRFLKLQLIFFFYLIQGKIIPTFCLSFPLFVPGLIFLPHFLTVARFQQEKTSECKEKFVLGYQSGFTVKFAQSVDLYKTKTFLDMYRSRTSEAWGIFR